MEKKTFGRVNRSLRQRLGQPPRGVNGRVEALAADSPETTTGVSPGDEARDTRFRGHGPEAGKDTGKIPCGASRG